LESFIEMAGHPYNSAAQPHSLWCAHNNAYFGQLRECTVRQ